jgi:RimJ/RimL family protein N-acetyltransferase
MELTPFKSTDYQLLVDWIESTHFNYQWGGPAYTFPLTIEQITAHCANREIFPFLFHSQGQIAGYAEFRKMPDGSCRICRVLILKDHRGNGLASEMLRLVIKEAKMETHCTKFSLSVFEHNTTAISLYKSLGFKVLSTEIRPETVCGKTWVAVEMEARL